MGGFGSMLGSLLSKAGELTHGAPDYMRSMEHELRTEGPTAHIDGALKTKMLEYTKTRQQFSAQMSKPVNDLWKAIKDDNPSNLDYKKAPLQDIHQDLQSRNHPAQAHTATLLQTNKPTKTIPQITSEIQAKSNLAAQVQTFGKDKEYISPLFYELYKSKNPADWTHADALAKIFSNVLHDKTAIRGYLSDTKFKNQTFVKKMNKLNAGIPDGIQAHVPTDLKHEYEPPSEREKSVGAWMRQYFAPMMAIPHIGTVFNLGSTPITMIAKGILSLPEKQFRQTIMDTGILASTMHSIMEGDLQARTGRTAKIVGPRAASLIQGALHNPGFHQVRLKQLMFGGAVGYHAAIEWAEQAAKGSKRAQMELREMNLDPAQIMKQGGKLTDSQLTDAIFHYVNNRFFIDKPMSRPLMSNANKWLRTATMFHAFVGYQSRFMRTEIVKMVKAGDWVSLAQYAGTIGILFPAIAPMLKSAETLVRTGSPSEAQEGMEHDYGVLLHPEFSREYLYTYIDMLSYLGAYGAYSHFLQAADSHRLASQILGPLGSMAATVGQDVINPASAMMQGKDPNFKPLGRDALRYGVPVAGAALSHQLLPNEPAPKRRRGRRYY